MISQRFSQLMSRALASLAIALAVTRGVTAAAAEPKPPELAAASPDHDGARLAATAASANVLDRISLDATAITGNRELPKVMSIVPWKSAEPPAGPDRPLGSLVEELLTPLDRDEFRREITYYDGLTSQSRTRDGQPAVSPARSVTSKESTKPSGQSGASTQ
jgi:hypothetical protein